MAELFVKSGEHLEDKDGNLYEVLVADDNLFALGKMRYSEEEKSWITSYENASFFANYSNGIFKSLDDLNLKKVK